MQANSNGTIQDIIHEMKIYEGACVSLVASLYLLRGGGVYMYVCTDWLIGRIGIPEICDYVHGCKGCRSVGITN